MNAPSGSGPGPTILLSAGCLFHLPLKRIASIGRDAGFVGMELIMNSPKLVPGPELERISEVLPIMSLHAPFRDWAAWGGHLGSWKATTALANSLPHADHITMHPPGSKLANMITNRWFEKACDLPLLLDARGRIRFSLENMPWAEGSPFSRDPLDKLLDQCRDRNVGLTFDVCHMGVSGRNVMDSIAKVPMDMLYNVHYSDARGHTEHLTPGKGCLPLADFLRHLGSRGYSRYVTLELEPAAFPDDIDGTVALLATLRQDMERHLASTPE
ncbi:MAG: sugar phosphate isomerase/epimerase [Pseudodesulfovibrio sp.]|uniref:Xylose isomerase domain-containing protein TIM barrel n=1 Tax=Pseudodesulfovibrio aespoeensis (strain ATCC 700646 / DSM 10631 / Aspo-2) TaxID=643562 RepID=E6VV28_PSEA9|nr:MULTISPECIES: sugar phosphate isomerase/epimerase [Pseudodesulfovibrio]MBU4192743.1 sugar phosphate isomerase/epimerase [Pseudomonadota bacterium]ADU61179.1 Xylose isomerase domain-containing protein TIM barrel [Pseudodesulfovibrio aespoeensis Aspo-2]MBU4244856.1 sugar phosphate isomerase/epimerase [Pseudomonadota bacterium]MBU4379407.1 sugar phosphate isomerase/epimerase [Pseudomonadota bacterium]MBU4476630.1 sugar phosphate isomerase/epimerase [Pseudomonadota bacterium]